VFAGASDATRPSSSDGDETVELSEPASVLGPLFQFMYPQPQPDLHTLPFPTLAALAEAAEKYMVYAALTVCRMRMECVMFFCVPLLFEETLLTVVCV
jgi:hypothetical protein